MGQGMRRETDPVYMREGKIPCGNILLPFPWFCRFPERDAFPAGRPTIFSPAAG